MSVFHLSWMKAIAESLRMKLCHEREEENVSLVSRDELGHTYGDQSDESQTFGLGSPVESSREKITTWEAGWNVTNAVQGIFVLGLPYALLQSGYLGLLFLMLSPLICSYTGKILVSCLYEEDENGHLVRVRQTYEDIANVCFRHLCPCLGGKLVIGAQLLELLMTCILYLVVSSNLICHSLFFSLPVSPLVCSAAIFLMLVPCMLIRDLRVVSKLSFFCSLAQFLITFLIIGYCLHQSEQWQSRNLGAEAVNFDGFQVGLGVIIFSYTSQIYLPTLEESMRNPSDFSVMMDWTHTLACGMKTSLSLLAFLTWGEQTKEVISDNLPSTLRVLVNLCLLVKALLSYPLPFFAAAEILQRSVLRSNSSSEWSDRWKLVIRGVLLLTTLLVAMCVPRFSLLMGLTGSVSGASMSLMLPALFHLKLKWNQMNSPWKILDVTVFLFGFFCSVSGLVCSIKQIIAAFEQD
ncbi:hypothetical protein DNTS_032392 [Danionella cerebrum]|uniref:Vesicular inhibitory amino acid transporter n=1 Tax=Danionella cerebrum TaxID=2873325 RepID=A0A553N140_9TELE|nr:hypothetical protein DNTS_032392 [Danionella translucida]